MKIRTYYNHIIRINNEEIPALPPFQRGQALANDKLLDIILYGTPRSWQKEMAEGIETDPTKPKQKKLNIIHTPMEATILLQKQQLQK